MEDVAAVERTLEPDEEDVDREVGEGAAGRFLHRCGAMRRASHTPSVVPGAGPALRAGRRPGRRRRAFLPRPAHQRDGRQGPASLRADRIVVPSSRSGAAPSSLTSPSPPGRPLYDAADAMDDDKSPCDIAIMAGMRGACD